MLHYVSSLSLTLLIIITVLTSNQMTLVASSTTLHRNTNFIKTSCGSTTYPDLCFTTLSIFASKIQKSPRLLALASLSETLKTVRATTVALWRLSRYHRLGRREVNALTDCAEVLSDTADELQRSIGEMVMDGGSGPAFRFRMNDILTWVSAALTNEDTCLEGFSGNSMNGNVKKLVRVRILNVAQMTSNALALANHFAFTRKGE